MHFPLVIPHSVGILVYKSCNFRCGGIFELWVGEKNHLSGALSAERTCCWKPVDKTLENPFPSICSVQRSLHGSVISGATWFSVFPSQWLSMFFISTRWKEVLRKRKYEFLLPWHETTEAIPLCCRFGALLSRRIQVLEGLTFKILEKTKS